MARLGPSSFCLMMVGSKESFTLAKHLLDLQTIQDYAVGQDIPAVHLHKT